MKIGHAISTSLSHVQAQICHQLITSTEPTVGSACCSSSALELRWGITLVWKWNACIRAEMIWQVDDSVESHCTWCVLLNVRAFSYSCPPDQPSAMRLKGSQCGESDHRYGTFVSLHEHCLTTYRLMGSLLHVHFVEVRWLIEKEWAWTALMVTPQGWRRICNGLSCRHGFAFSLSN